LAAVGAIASLVVAAWSVAPSRGDDKPAVSQSAASQSANGKLADVNSKSANGSAKAAVNPLAVPDGNAQELLKFIGKVRTLRAPRKQSPADSQAFVAKKCEAIIAAADKILATDAEGNTRVSALQSKLQALAALDDTGDDQAGTSLAAFVDQLKDDKQPGVSKLTKRYVAQAADVTSAATTGKMEIKASHLDGTPFDPSTVKRKVTLVELWATTCGACRAEMPNIARDYAKYHNRGFEVVSISMDTDKSLVEKFLQDNPSMTWQILFGGSSMGVSYPGQHSGEFSIPKMMLVSKRGVVLSDSVSDEELTSKLVELLGP